MRTCFAAGVCLLALAAPVCAQERTLSTPEGRQALNGLLAACQKAGAFTRPAAGAPWKIDREKLHAKVKARRDQLTPALRAALLVASFRASPADRPVLAALLDAVGREVGDHRCAGFGALLRGVALVGAGQLPAAGEAYRQSVRFLEAGRSPDLQALAMDNLGFVLSSQGRPAQARGYHARALAVYRRLYPAATHPNGHYNLARSLNNLGGAHAALGDTANASACLEEAVALYRKLYPAKDHPNGHLYLARTLGNLASLREEQGDCAEARKSAREALAMCRRLYPQKDHPEVALALGCLADVDRARGDLAGAQEGYEEALAIYRRVPAADRPAVLPHYARLLAHYADVLEARGDYARAQVPADRALALYRILHPTEREPDGHPQLASALNNVASIHLARGDSDAALRTHREALAMRQRLYPPERYPDGHPELAVGLNNLGLTLAARGDYKTARVHYQEALAMFRRLYPEARYPAGHPRLASSLNHMGALLRRQGDLVRARTHLEESLQMRRLLYPRDRYPNGHPELAHTLTQLGAMLEAQGEFSRARDLHEKALAMLQGLFPRDRYPDGHPHLAACLNNLGGVLRLQGEVRLARHYYEKALAMWQRLYPESRYPDGHPELALALNNVGFGLAGERDFARAEAYYHRAVAMCRRLYPADRYPDGHSELARCLTNLADVAADQGHDARARRLAEQALAMYRRLYPEARYPHGHPHLVIGLGNLGGRLLERGLYEDALPHLAELVVTAGRLFEAFAASSSEAEALNRAGPLLAARDPWLSVTAELRHPAGEVYAAVWRGKAVQARLLQRRRELAAADADTRALAGRLRATRDELARLLLTPPQAAGFRPDRARELTDLKEKLERDLAEKLPGLKQRRELDRLTPADLARALPDGAGFIDVYRYLRFFRRPAGKATLPARAWHYAAFIVRPGQAVTRVELGPAAPIDADLERWHALLRQDGGPRDRERMEAVASRLGERLWRPLRAHLPARGALWICPDGALHQLPWAALPGRATGTVLLEDHALAVVPHAGYLLERLREGRGPRREPGPLLVLGGLDYDRGPATRTSGGPVPGDAQRRLWAPLPATRGEVSRVLELARQSRRSTLPALTGNAADGATLSAALAKAGVAHLATHGFFADPRVRSLFQLDAARFARAGRERVTPGARNPLALSGLVLSGANRPAAAAGADRGIFTAEAVAGLDLDRLELVVLSACDTGLGDVAGGEGVFGLQRAFHLAGSRDVVASLWTVNDEATRALMALFYRNLWVHRMAPAEALRQAQLHLYRHPGEVKGLARRSMPDFTRTVPLPKEKKAGGPAPAAGKGRAPAHLWAAFVLSGAGR